MTHPFFTAMLLCVIGAGTLLSGCDSSQAPVLEPRIRPVRTAIVSETPKAFYRRFAGGSQAAVNTTLSFRLSGILAERPVKVGQSLQAGQLIARLDDKGLMLNVQKDEASLQQVLAQAQNARSQFEQIQNLYDRQLVSRKEFESAETSYHATQARVEQSRRTAALSRQQLAYSRLYSPADGCSVSETHADVNETVSAGQAIVTLNCGTSIEVVVAVPEGAINDISIGDQALVQFPSLKEREFPAVVTEIGTPGVSNSAYPVTLQLQNEKSVLRPGMAAEVSFEVMSKHKTDNLWIPLLAAGKEAESTFVFVFEATSDGFGVVRRRVIKTGAFTLEEVEVLEGLQSGEHIITAGLSQIHDGLKVKRLASATGKAP